MRAVLALAFIGVIACGASASATSKDDGLRSSIASALLKQKTQIRILRHDDSVSNCANKSFASAAVVTQPRSESSGNGVSMRKWQEQWVLNRCGTQVGYRVFFTDAGDGGAYFSISPHD